MAQLDPSIPLSVRPPQFESPQNLLMNSVRLKSAQLQLADQQQAAGERNALADVLRQPDSYDAIGNLQRSAIPQIAQASPGSVGTYSQVINQQDQAAARQQQIRMDAARKNVEFQAQLLGTVTDQASYDRAKQQFAAAGGNINQLPPAYDPQWVAQARQGALTASQQFDQQYKMHTQANDDARLQLQRDNQAFNQQNPNRQIVTGPNGELLAVDPKSLNTSAVPGPNGQPLGPKPVTLNDTQAKANLFASRMDVADKILNDLAAKGVDMPSVIKSGAESVPIVGQALGAAANAFVASPEQQKVEQAQRDFVNAVLRRESGAAIAPSEFDSAKKQYFPAIGDSPEVIQQKAENRRTAIEGLKAEVPANFTAQQQAKQAAPAAKPGDYSHLWGN